MPIEFRCDQCHKLLRTGDDTAGKQAKCPECGAVMTVPTPKQCPAPHTQPAGQFEALASPFGAASPQPSPESTNPYQSPTGISPGPQFFAPPGQIQPTQIEFSEMFSRAWAVFVERWLPAAAAVLIVFVMNMIASLVANIILGAINAAVDDPAVVVSLNILVQLPFQIFTLWLTIGMQLFCLNLVRGGESNYGLIFAGARFLLPVILFTLIYGLLAFVGFIMFIIPGVIVLLMFMQTQLLIIDRNMGVMDAMAMSRDVMRGNKLTMFLIGIVAIIAAVVIGLPLTIFTCGLGYFVVGAYGMILTVVLYLGVTGQPTMVDRYAAPLEESGDSPFGQPAPGGPGGGSPFASYMA